MSFINICKTCGSNVRIPDDAEGKRVRCPECKTVFVAEYRFSAEEFYRENGVTRERLWVGDIVGLITDVAQVWEHSTIQDWTIYLALPEFRTLAVESSNRRFLERGVPHCSLGECDDFQLLKSAMEAGTFPEPVIQRMAFQICRRIEPDWDEIVARKW